MRTLYLFLAFVLTNNIIIAQDCKSLELESKLLFIQYSKLKKESVSKQLDSLRAVTKTGCKASLMYLHTVDGRLKKDKGDSDQARMSYYKTLEIAEELKDVFIQKNTYNLIATSYSNDGTQEKSVNTFQKALALKCHPDSTSCLKQDIKLKINLAECYRSLDSIHQAISTFGEVSEMMEDRRMHDSMYYVVINNSTGMIYEEQIKDDSTSLIYYKRALEYCPRNHPVKISMQNNVGHAFRRLNIQDSARLYYNKTLDATDNPRYRFTPTSSLGDLEAKKENFEQALRYYDEAYKLAKASKVENYIYQAIALKGKALYKLKKYNLSLKALNEAIKIYEAKNAIHSEQHANGIVKYKLLSEAALQNPEFHNSLVSHLEVKDSLNDVNRISELDNSLARLENRIMQDSIKLKQATIDKAKLRNQKNIYGILSLLMGLVGALFFMNKFRKRFISERTQKEGLIFEKAELERINRDLKNRLTTSIPQPSNTQLEFTGRGSTRIIASSEIHYVLAESNGSRIFTSESNFWTDMRFRDTCNILSENNFVQIYRSILVNIDEIAALSAANIKLKSGHELKIGRTYKQELKEKIKERTTIVN